MIDLIGQLGFMDTMFLITAGLLAVVGIGSDYKWPAGIIFAMFSIIIGAQTIFLSDYFIWATVASTSFYYLILFVLYLTASCIFFQFKSYASSVVGLGIVIYLGYTMLGSLAGVEPTAYESNMAILWLLQLICGLFGVVNGYGLLNGVRHMFSNIWSNITYRYHKGL